MSQNLKIFSPEKEQGNDEHNLFNMNSFIKFINLRVMEYDNTFMYFSEVSFNINFIGRGKVGKIC